MVNATLTAPIPARAMTASIPHVRQVDLDSIPYLVQMTEDGIYLNNARLDPLRDDLTAMLAQNWKLAHEQVGTDFNLNSGVQVAEVLFGHLGLRQPGRKTKGGSIATDADTLETLKKKNEHGEMEYVHPVIKTILDYKHAGKMLSTYVDGLPRWQDANSRIHPRWQHTRVSSGRLSCVDPNIMNIPVRTKLGNRVREAFTPHQPDWRMFSVDFSQIELRVLAWISGDPAMSEAFHKGFDIHKYTASLVAGIPMEQVTYEQRRDAKTTNFLIVYGGGWAALLESIPNDERDPEKHTREWAQKFIDTYFSRYPKIREFISRSQAYTRRHGFIVDVFGRRRYLPEIFSTNNGLRMSGEREAQNMPIQATASGIMRIAMGLLVDMDGTGILDGYIKAGKIKCIAQIHDELLFEAHESVWEECAQAVKLVYQSCAPWMDIPITADIETGESWGEMEETEEAS